MRTWRLFREYYRIDREWTPPLGRIRSAYDAAGATLLVARAQRLERRRSGETPWLSKRDPISRDLYLSLIAWYASFPLDGAPGGVAILAGTYLYAHWLWGQFRQWGKGKAPA